MLEEQDSKINTDELQAKGYIMEELLQDIENLRFPIRKMEDSISNICINRCYSEYSLSELLKYSLVLNKEITMKIEEAIINGMVFSSEIYNEILEKYISKNYPCDYEFITALMEQKLENKLPNFACRDIDFAFMYINCIYEKISYEQYDDVIYDSYKEYLLNFCSKMNYSEKEQQEINQRLNDIEKNIVEDILKEVEKMQNTYEQFTLYDYEEKLQICEKYAPENPEVLKLRNFVLDWKCSDLEEEIKSFNED